ncbi:MAG: Z1 domain-containing protein, partial [Cetobacterium sp.]
TSRFTGVHEQVSNLTEKYLNSLKESLISFGKLSNPENQSSDILEIKNTYINLCNNKDFSFEKIIKKLTDIIGTIYVREVHQKSKIPLVYRKDAPTNVIAVGGTSLSRGYTLEGLSITYFTRNSLFYDTLMQMGRWFGYRPGYDELCKVFIPKTISNHFINIVNATDDLMNNLNYMRKLGKNPEEFGLGVQSYPATKLQITAKNKMKAAKEIPIKLNLNGCLKENALIPKTKTEKEKVLENIRSLIKKIVESNYELKKVGENYLWKDVETSLILEFFKNILETSKYDQYGLDIGFPIQFIIKKLERYEGKTDIAFFSTKECNIEIIPTVIVGSQRRKIGNSTDEYYIVNKHKVSTSTPERIILENLKIELTGKDIRRDYMKKPLLMLHILSLYEKFEFPKEDIDIDGIFGAYGIAFPEITENNNPSSRNNEDEGITLMVNSVYIENLLKEKEIDLDEDYGDDYDE